MENLYDVVIIGGGPAGLTAALYLARAKYRVVVLEKEAFGGQIIITEEIVNYPGVNRTSGTALTEKMRLQAEEFGAEFMLTEATRLEMAGDIKKVHTTRGVLSCFGILLATGAHPRMVGFEGEEAFKGHGVAYCATCDGEFFTGKEVFVVGGGFAAAEESVFLTKYASHVTILIREDDFTCAAGVAEKARNHEKITVKTNVEVTKVAGDTALRELYYKSNATGETFVYKAKEGESFGVFVFAGYEPATELIKGLAVLNEHGYVITDRSQQTSVPGLYAAGDVCIKSLRQVVTATGDGALAATELEHYVAGAQKRTGKKAVFPERNRTGQKNSSAAETGDSVQQESSGGSAAKGQGAGALFSEDMRAQLKGVFERMASNLILELYLDERPVSRELQAYMEELAGMTDKLSVKPAEDEKVLERPCVRILKPDGTWTGLAFHGVPGGHEFTSFVLGLYNAAGPGQPLEEGLIKRIREIDHVTEIQILVSLSCTMCPDLVTAAQKIASLNPLVKAEVYDLNHFPEKKEKYQVMSVPCFIIDEGTPQFGKKNVEQLLNLI